MRALLRKRIVWDIGYRGPETIDAKPIDAAHQPAFQGGEGGSSSSSSGANAVHQAPIPNPPAPAPQLQQIRPHGGSRGSKRPPHIWPAEAWTMLSKAQKQQCIAEWEAISQEEKDHYLQRVIAVPATT